MNSYDKKKATNGYQTKTDNYGGKFEDFKLDDRQCYLGNQLIKRARVKYPYTAWQMQEYLKCASDPIYFIEKYIQIISIDDGMIGFSMYDYQRELVKSYAKHRFNISLQSRQSGKTQTTAAFILWFALFHPDKTVAILANKAAQAREIIARITTSLEGLPYFLQAGCKILNKGRLEFDNNSRIVSAASSSSSIRGMSISLLYIDEAAFIPNDMEFYESTYPVVTSGKNSRVIITSTPKGARGLFYKLYQEAVEGINSYKTTKVTWDMVPGRDDAWKQETINNTSEAQFAQEMDCEFMGSVGTLIASAFLRTMIFKNPISQNDDIDIYSLPIEGRKYIMTVDCAHGVGGDYSTFTVFDITEIPYRIAAKYRNNEISPMVYPTIIHNVGRMYHDCPVLVEINDIGSQIATILYYDLEYEEMLLVSSKGGKQQIGGGFGANVQLGIKTSTQVKAIGCANLKTLVEKEKLEIHDIDMIGELGTFISKGKSYEADDGCYDDTVATLFLFSWLSTQEYFKDLFDTDVRKSVAVDSFGAMENALTPFGFINDGREEAHIDSEGTLWLNCDPNSESLNSDNGVHEFADW